MNEIERSGEDAAALPNKVQRLIAATRAAEKPSEPSGDQQVAKAPSSKFNVVKHLTERGIDKTNAELVHRLRLAGIPVIAVAPNDTPKQAWAKVPFDEQPQLSRFETGDSLYMLCGHGIDAVDEDTKTVGNSVDNLVPFKHFGVTRTPSGGRHFIVPSSGLGKISPLVGVGDYCGGRADGTGRLGIYLPGSKRDKYPDGSYEILEAWDIDACLAAQPDPDLIDNLLALRPTSQVGGKGSGGEVVWDGTLANATQQAKAKAVLAKAAKELGNMLPGSGREPYLSSRLGLLYRFVLAGALAQGEVDESMLEAVEKQDATKASHEATWSRVSAGAWAWAERVGGDLPWVDNTPDFAAIADTCQVDRTGLFVCGGAPFDFMAPYQRPQVHVGQDADLLNVAVRSALLRANEASVSPSLAIVNGLLSTVGYRNIARLRRDGEAVDGFEVCVPEVLVAGPDILAGLLAAAAELVRTDAKGHQVPAGVPMAPLKMMLASGDLPRFPVVRSVGSVPTIGLDGSVLDRPGYYGSPDFHLMTDDMETDWRRVPDQPTDAEVAEAADLLRLVVSGFPFAEDEGWASRANAVAYLLTPPLRKHFNLAPVFAFDATMSQTGKTLLATLAQIMWVGAANLTTMPGSREEMRKLLFAQLLGGAQLVVWDNVDATVDSGPLASVVTAPSVSDRILGLSKNATVANDAIHVLTGNKLQVSGELFNRIVMIRLDAHDPHPELRSGFNVELPTWAWTHRADLVWAAHVLISRWFNDGRPAGSIGTLGDGSNWVGWARLMGGVLSHVERVTGEGFGNFMGNYATRRDEFVEDAAESDPVVVAKALSRCGKGWHTGGEVWEAGTFDEEFTALAESSLKTGRLLKRCSGHTFEYGGRNVRIVFQKRDNQNVYRLAVEAAG